MAKSRRYRYRLPYNALHAGFVIFFYVIFAQSVPLNRRSDRNEHLLRGHGGTPPFDHYNPKVDLKRLFNFRNLSSVRDFQQRLELMKEHRPKMEKYMQKEHNARLHAIAYFFKVYNKRIDSEVQSARALIEKHVGGDVIENLFSGRASLFEPGGAMAKYNGYVHELAGMHEQPEEVRTKTKMEDVIALIEERIESGLIEVTSYHSIDISPMEEVRELANEPYFRNWEKLKQEKKESENKMNIAEEMATVADALKRKAMKIRSTLTHDTKAKESAKKQRMLRDGTEDLSDERQKSRQHKSKDMKEAVKKDSVRNEENQKQLLVVKKKYKLAEQAYKKLRRDLQKSFEADLCFSCKQELKWSKIDANFSCDCANTKEEGGEGEEEANMSSLLSIDESTTLDTCPMCKEDKELSETKAVIDFEVVKFPPSRCKNIDVDAELMENEMYCLQDKHGPNHSYTFTFAPRRGGKSSSLWTDTPDGTKLETRFDRFSMVEINVFGGGLFNWKLPKGKTVEIELKFNLRGVKDTTCLSLLNEPYKVEITEQQQRQFFQAHNPFFDGRLKGTHEISWSKEELKFVVSNYFLGSMAKTIRASPPVISIRVPYDKLRPCSTYLWAPEAEQSIFPTLEVRVAPYTKMSCKLDRAATCSEALVQKTEKVAPLSPRLCALLRKINVRELNVWRATEGRCPKAAKLDDQSRLEEAAKTTNKAEQVYKKAAADALDSEIALGANRALANNLGPQEAPSETVGLTPAERKKMEAGLKDLEHDEKEAEETAGDWKAKAKSRKEKLVCKFGKPKSEVKGRPGSNGGPEKDGDPSSMYVDPSESWPNGVPPGAEGLIDKVKATHKARVMAWKAAAAAALMMSGAGGVEFGKQLAIALSDIISKVGRAATAMSTGLAMTMWQGKQSAPWIYNGRLEKLCKIHIVERQDWCNKKNDECLEKCPSPGRPLATVCEIMINLVTDPGIETLLKNPPPVGVGPAPPFVMPPCMQQGQCQKPVGDDVMQDIMKTFQDSIKEMIKKTAKVGMAFADAAKSSAEAAAAMAFVDVGARNEVAHKKILGLRDSKYMETALIDETLEAKTNSPVVPAAAAFGKALLNGWAVEIQHKTAHIDLLKLKVSEAKGCPKIILRQKLKSQKAKLQIIKTKQKKALAKEAELKKDLKKMLKGPKPSSDRTYKFEAPFGDPAPTVICPKFDILGCACASLPAYPTLGAPQCKEMKAIMTSEKNADFNKAAALNFFMKGVGQAKQMKHKALMAEQEGDGLDGLDNEKSESQHSSQPLDQANYGTPPDEMVRSFEDYNWELGRYRRNDKGGTDRLYVI